MRDYVNLRNGQCIACVHPIRDTRGKLGEHEGSVRDARGVNYINIVFFFTDGSNNCKIVVV